MDGTCRNQYKVGSYGIRKTIDSAASQLEPEERSWHVFVLQQEVFKQKVTEMIPFSIVCFAACLLLGIGCINLGSKHVIERFSTFKLLTLRQDELLKGMTME